MISNSISINFPFILKYIYCFNRQTGDLSSKIDKSQLCTTGADKFFAIAYMWLCSAVWVQAFPCIAQFFLLDCKLHCPRRNLFFLIISQEKKCRLIGWLLLRVDSISIRKIQESSRIFLFSCGHQFIDICKCRPEICISTSTK